MNASLAPAGIRMRPSPQGHNPAIARISVLLPEPDSPPSSTRSPGLTLMSVSSMTTRPSRCTIDRSDHFDVGLTGVLDHDGRRARGIVVHLVERLVQLLRPPCRRRPLGQADEVLGKPVERSQHGDERSRNLHDGAEAQITRQIFGRRQQHRKHGGEKSVTVHQVRWQCWRTTSSQRAATVAKVSLSRSRSSSAPLISAMLSAFSRTRVSS